MGSGACGVGNRVPHGASPGSGVRGRRFRGGRLCLRVTRVQGEPRGKGHAAAAPAPARPDSLGARAGVPGRSWAQSGPRGCRGAVLPHAAVWRARPPHTPESRDWDWAGCMRQMAKAAANFLGLVNSLGRHGAPSLPETTNHRLPAPVPSPVNPRLPDTSVFCFPVLLGTASTTWSIAAQILNHPPPAPPSL